MVEYSRHDWILINKLKDMKKLVHVITWDDVAWDDVEDNRYMTEDEIAKYELEGRVTKDEHGNITIDFVDYE